MLYEIISKLVSESLLSLYPIFVKLTNLPISIQLWSRFFTYILISLFFVNISFIYKNIFTKNAVLLSIVTIVHVYASYRGFQLLDSGVAYVIFYIYPLFILLLSGQSIHPIMILTLIGVYLVSMKDTYTDTNKKPEIKETNGIKETYEYEGILMILIASITEALVYFVVRRIKTNNNWNHLFISYFFGAILLSIYYNKSILLTINEYKEGTLLNNKVIISLALNIIIGVFGYVLRFYAISRLPPNIYAPLSYFGVLMAYIYGIFLNNDVITINKILGSIMIIIPNFFINYQ